MTTAPKKKRKTPFSTTKATLAELRKRDILAGVTEKWNPHAHIRQDLWGFVDIIAVEPDGDTVGIQTTVMTGRNAHLAKMRKGSTLNNAIRFLQGKNTRIELWLWRKLKEKRGGKRERWEPEVQVVTMDDLLGVGDA